MKQFLSCVAVATMLVFAPQSRAEENLGIRAISAVGCHETDGTCFVTLGGSAFGSSQNCMVINEARWDDADQANGRRTFAALLAAFLAGRNIEVAIGGCSAQKFPKIAWFRIVQ